MSDFFKWDSAQYSVHVASMDEEHQTLIQKMNALHKAHREKKPAGEILPLLKDLGDYTVKHFTDEEAYMQKIKFAGFTSHKIIHQQLLTKLGTFVDEFKRSEKLSDEFFQFLKFWLVSHICQIDAKYGDIKQNVA